MKKSLVAMAVLALAAGSAFATGNHNPAPSAGYVVAGATGSNSLVSGSVSGAVASGTGSATSSSFNQGYAATGVSVSGAVDANVSKNTVITQGSALFGKATRTTVETKSGNVGVEGYTVTANMSGAQSTQTGSAIGGAAAGGIASANAVGAGAFDTGSGGSPEGSVAGGSHAFTASAAASVGNGSNFQNAGMSSDFGAQASADIATTTVQKGATILTVFVPTSQPSQSDVKNVATSTYGNAGSNGGFAVPAPYANAGTAVGGVINNASGAAIANASVSGQVSAGLAGL